MSVPNIEKLFQYLKCVAKEPIRYEGYLTSTGKFRLPKEIVEYLDEPKINFIKLNSTFFDNDYCLNCGGCDPAEANIFTATEYKKILETTDQDLEDYGLDPRYLHQLKNGLYSMTHMINEADIDVWVYPQDVNQLYLPTRSREIKRCSWCFQSAKSKFKCRIHPITSITCVMPHLRFYHMHKSSKTSVGIHQFGRNWALKCPVTFTPPETEDQFNKNKQNRIEKLIRLNQAGQDLNIETYLEDVIGYVQNIEYEDYEDHLNINIIDTKKHSIPLF